MFDDPFAGNSGHSSEAPGFGYSTHSSDMMEFADDDNEDYSSDAQSQAAQGRAARRQAAAWGRAAQALTARGRAAQALAAQAAAATDGHAGPASNRRGRHTLKISPLIADLVPEEAYSLPNKDWTRYTRAHLRHLTKAQARAVSRHRRRVKNREYQEGLRRRRAAKRDARDAPSQVGLSRTVSQLIQDLETLEREKAALEQRVAFLELGLVKGHDGQGGDSPGGDGPGHAQRTPSAQ